MHISKKSGNFATEKADSVAFFCLLGRYARAHCSLQRLGRKMVNTNKKFNTKMEKIDELDRKILAIITRNARIPFKEVADMCGVSRAAIHQRVQKMFDNGVIIGSGYQVNPKMLGYQLCVYVGIILTKASMYKDVSAALENIPEVVESQFTLGSYSMLIKLYAKDDQHLMELLNAKIQEIPGVANTETLTALDQRINRGLPIEQIKNKK